MYQESLVWMRREIIKIILAPSEALETKLSLDFRFLKVKMTLEIPVANSVGLRMIVAK